MMEPELAREQLIYVHGYLLGLAGTTRYKMPDALRQELRTLADQVEKVYDSQRRDAVRAVAGKVMNHEPGI